MVSRYPGAVLPPDGAGIVLAAPDVLGDAPCPPRHRRCEESPSAHMTLVDVYRDHFSFVWRMVRRLGVDEAQVEDAVQDVFIVVHRRLDDFEQRSSVRTWLAGIVRRVVHDYRRTKTRKPAIDRRCNEPAVDDLSDEHATPEDHALANEAAVLLHLLLDGLDDDKREIFILAELEQWSLAEIAETTGINVNTAASRLRLAREAFEVAAQRLRARDEWRLR